MRFPAQQAKSWSGASSLSRRMCFYQQTPESFGRWRWCCWLRKVVEFEGSLLVAVEQRLVGDPSLGVYFSGAPLAVLRGVDGPAAAAVAPAV